MCIRDRGGGAGSAPLNPPLKVTYYVHLPNSTGGPVACYPSRTTNGYQCRLLTSVSHDWQHHWLLVNGRCQFVTPGVHCLRPLHLQPSPVVVVVVVVVVAHSHYCRLSGPTEVGQGLSFCHNCIKYGPIIEIRSPIKICGESAIERSSLETSPHSNRVAGHYATS